MFKFQNTSFFPLKTDNQANQTAEQAVMLTDRNKPGAEAIPQGNRPGRTG